MQTRMSRIKIRRYMSAAGWVLTFMLFATFLCGAQTAGSLEEYSAAAKNPHLSEQTSAFERFISTNPGSSLTRDAMEFLLWDYMQSASYEKADELAQRLNASEPNNPLALAILYDRDPRRKLGNLDSLTTAIAGLQRSQQLRQPEGMRNIDFAVLRQFVWRSLTATAGYAYLDRKEYSVAAQYLRELVASTPNDARYAYALALALLDQPKPNLPEGYWYLARAVTLSGTSASAAQISTYARMRYREDGGTDENWNRFVAVASAPRTGLAPVVTASRSGVPITTNTASPTVANTNPTTPSEPSRTSKTTNSTTATARAGVPNLPPSKTRSEVAIPIIPPRPRFSAGTPISLGILIQTNRLTPRYRQILINTLSDFVRHLRQNDEAFILAFSDKLDFVQDLTNNAQLLEEAIDHLQPSSGAALFDAVAFAAGHLSRVARNQNRVILLISDGSSAAGEVSSFDVAAQIRLVQVDCIGLNVSSSNDRSVLSVLAEQTGGQSLFAEGPIQFRDRAWQFASSLGISFPR